MNLLKRIRKVLQESGNKIVVILGLQWGDEGKGKIIDYLAKFFDIIVRFQGGANAGHTVWINKVKYVLHLIPSGILRGKILVLGNSMVIDPIVLEAEMIPFIEANIPVKNLLKVAYRAQLTIPTHIMLDKAYELYKQKGKVGSTGRGIGTTIMDKATRMGIEFGLIHDMDTLKEKFNALEKYHLAMIDMLSKLCNIDIISEIKYDLAGERKKWFASLKLLRSLELIDPVTWFAERLAEGKKILAEGAQGLLLDIDLGAFPYVTSSNTSIGGVCASIGVPPETIGRIIGITKAYLTRVGEGDMPTEQKNEIGEKLRQIGMEVGATTGRPRRCGWLDLPLLRYACIANGVHELIVTKVDILDTFEEIKVCTHYLFKGKEEPIWKGGLMPLDKVEPVYKTYRGWSKSTTAITDEKSLPIALYSGYIEDVFENELGIPVYAITNGPDRDNFIRIHPPLHELIEN